MDGVGEHNNIVMGLEVIVTCWDTIAMGLGVMVTRI